MIVLFEVSKTSDFSCDFGGSSLVDSNLIKSMSVSMFCSCSAICQAMLSDLFFTFSNDCRSVIGVPHKQRSYRESEG